MNSSDYVADIANMNINISPHDMKWYIAILEVKVAKLAAAALPGYISESGGAVNCTATPPSRMTQLGKVPPASLAIKNEISPLGRLIKVGIGAIF